MTRAVRPSPYASLRVLVLGAGSIGTRHARNLHALGADVAIADADPERAAAAVPGVEAVPGDLRRLGDFDGVVIATPTALHREHAAAALGTRARVLVEKPMSATVERLDELVERAGDRLMVGYNLRLHRPVERLRELVLAGRVGVVVRVHAWFGSWLPDWRPGVDYRTTYSARAAGGGGVLRDASHELDLLVWLFGAEWKVEGAVLAKRSRLDLDVEDVAIALLRSRAGIPAIVDLDAVSRRYRRGLEIVGDEATVRLDWTTSTIEIADEFRCDTEPASTPIDESYVREAEAFLEFVAGRRDAVVSATAGAVSVRLAEEIRAAAQLESAPTE